MDRSLFTQPSYTREVRIGQLQKSGKQRTGGRGRGGWGEGGGRREGGGGGGAVQIKVAWAFNIQSGVNRSEKVKTVSRVAAVPKVSLELHGLNQSHFKSHGPKPQQPRKRK